MSITSGSTPSSSPPSSPSAPESLSPSMPNMTFADSSSSSSSSSAASTISESYSTSVFISEPGTPTSPAAVDQYIVPSNAPAELNLLINPEASEEEKLITYSQAVYEYTRQLWIESRRQAEFALARQKQRERERSVQHYLSPAVNFRQHMSQGPGFSHA
ncbi:hypothetical protein DL93DRAFT_2162653 [Clavulina sp. PMI_390]|nr:hypothetical protein DL93DRAFT_2162653 [Clavulina sp. PMI_390]